MPKLPTAYPSVADWVDADYRRSPNAPSKLSEVTLARVGRVVGEVHPHSPAGRLGVEPGDILHAINGKTFNAYKLERSFRARTLWPIHKFSFFRPSTHEAYDIGGVEFPFGMRLRESVFGLQSALTSGDPDPSEVQAFWAMGDMNALSILWMPLEILNLRVLEKGGAPWGAPAPKRIADDAPLCSTDDFWMGHQVWLALCAAVVGNTARARFVLDGLYAHFEKTGESAMMASFAAMAYTEALLSEDTDAAVHHLQRAIDMAPEIAEPYRKLSEVTGHRVTPPPSPYLGVRPTYSLPRFDPSSKFDQPAGTVSLGESVAQLNPGEFVLVCVMSRYRVNGPYIEGFTRALTPLSRLRGRFAEVHVITSWSAESSRDIFGHAMEPALRKAGVAVSVLYDEAGTVSDQLSLISAPTYLLVGHDGLVAAEGWLGDDQILWEALSKSAS